MYAYACRNVHLFYKEENFYILSNVDTLSISQSTIDSMKATIVTDGYVPSDYSQDNLTAVTAC